MTEPFQICIREDEIPVVVQALNQLQVTLKAQEQQLKANATYDHEAFSRYRDEQVMACLLRATSHDLTDVCEGSLPP